MSKLFKWKTSKISTKLSISYGLILLITFIIVNAVILFSLTNYMNHISSEQLVSVNNVIQSDIHNLSDLESYDYLELSRSNENIEILIIENETVILTTGVSTYFPFNSSLKEVKSLESGEVTVMYLTDVITMPDNSKFNVQIIKSMDNEQDYLNALSSRIICIDLGIILISVLVGFFISKKALSPIDSMTKQAQLISTSNLNKRIEIVGPDDELSRLANTFNDLISRLSNAYYLQNQFALNASHELSTPLSVIKGYIDLINRWGKEKPEIFEEAILSINTELSNMTNLLDSLYTISKTDNELIPIIKSDLILNHLIEQIIKEQHLIHPKQFIQFTSNESIIVNADERLLTQLIRALLDNSIKYNVRENPIIIGLLQDKNSIKFSVEDTGVGISREDVEHIFERFYRVDKARNRTIGGTGLGLSIVKWIVEMHQGTITVQSELNIGTKITVSLPK